MNNESQERATATEKFRDAFKACVEDNRVRPDRSVFYIKWGQAFVNFLPGKRLRDRSLQDIETFLANLGRRPVICGVSDAAEYHDRYLYDTGS